MNYKQIQEYIDSLPRFIPKKDAFDLQNMYALMERLENVQNRLKIIHFTGTNGKGSTIAFTEEILRSAGLKVGVYTSPYFKEYEEMIRINGRMIDKEQFVQLFCDIKEAAQGIAASEFELFTALAFMYFAKENCDIVLLEVGLGGRMDATNVILHSLVSVFTPISYDHMQVLGEDIREIASHKADIIKKDSFVITARQIPAISEILKNKAWLQNCGYAQAKEASNIRMYGYEKQVFDMPSYAMKDIEIGMAGQYQIDNAVLAIEIAMYLKSIFSDIDEESIRVGLCMARWRGRFEIVRKKPCCIIDGAHNAAGVERFVESFMALFQERQAYFIIGLLRDKEYESMIQTLAPLIKKAYVIDVPSPRSLEKEVLRAKVEEYGVVADVFQTIEEAVDTAVGDAEEEGIVVALGSLYYIDLVRERLCG